MYYVEKLSDFYSNLSFEEIPEEVIRKARISLFDFIIVLLAGKQYGVLTSVIESYVRNKGSEEDVYAFGLGVTTSDEHAALAMGVISHSVELDDGHRFGTAHPAVAIIPAVLATAYKNKSSFKEIIKAISIGYDMMLRLARSINPSHLRRGFHSTGTCGAVGAAAAAATIHKFDSKKTMFSISLGALHSSGLQEMLHSHPSIKAIQPGKAAQAGVFSTNLVSFGAKSPVSVFEGQHGWIKAMTDEFCEEDLMGELGSRWEIINTYTKLYPTCRHCHQAIDLAIDLFKSGYRLGEISTLNIYLYNVAISEVGQIKNPANFEQAMFSVSYAVSIALKYGKVGIQELKNCIHDEDIINFSNYINIIEDSEMNQKYPVERGSKIEMYLENNKNIILINKLPKGEYDTKLEDSDYLEKAKNVLLDVATKETINEFWSIVVEEPIDKADLYKIEEIFERVGEKNGATRYCTDN